MQWLIRKLIICAFTLAFAPVAPPGLSNAFAQANGDAYDKGLLWRVEKPGAAPSYLFGTVHIADKRVTALPDAVRKELDAAQSFTMEIALDQSNIATLAARMVYMDGRDLPGVAGEDLFRKTVALTAGLGLPADVARLFKPWAMVLMLEMPQQSMGDVLDVTLHQIASQQGKSLDYLETVDDQVAAFENMPDADQVALLRLAVETHHELASETEKLLQAYLQRDLGLMWQISESEVARRPELRPVKAVFDQHLLYNRNTRMVQRMQPQLGAGNAFVAVGALHLYGEKGLLSLLARDGYRVSRVY
jgi:hypothetical protein